MFITRQVQPALVAFALCCCCLCMTLAADANVKAPAGKLKKYLLQPMNSTLELVALLANRTATWKFVHSAGSVDTLFDKFDHKPRHEPARFVCMPSEGWCDRLDVVNFDLDTIGTYRVTSMSSLDNQLLGLDYHVATFLPLEFNCSAASSTPVGTCQYAANKLTVLANSPVSVTCSAIVIQGSDGDDSGGDFSAARVRISSDQRGEECADESTTATKLSLDDSSSSSLPTGITADMLQQIVRDKLTVLRVSKTCARSFAKSELDAELKCDLVRQVAELPAPHEAQYQAQLSFLLRRNASSSLTPQVRATSGDVYATRTQRLDVHYGPEFNAPAFAIFNKTLIDGYSQPTTFTCPFSGNPAPAYYWRVASVLAFNKSSSSSSSSSADARRPALTKSSEFALATREFTVPRNLTTGQYVFECHAEVRGLTNNASQPLAFHLVVMRKCLCSLTLLFQSINHSIFIFYFLFLEL